MRTLSSEAYLERLPAKRKSEAGNMHDGDMVRKGQFKDFEYQRKELSHSVNDYNTGKLHRCLKGKIPFKMLFLDVAGLFLSTRCVKKATISNIWPEYFN